MIESSGQNGQISRPTCTNLRHTNGILGITSLRLIGERMKIVNRAALAAIIAAFSFGLFAFEPSPTEAKLSVSPSATPTPRKLKKRVARHPGVFDEGYLPLTVKAKSRRKRHSRPIRRVRSKHHSVNFSDSITRESARVWQKRSIWINRDVAASGSRKVTAGIGSDNLKDHRIDLNVQIR